MNTDCDPHTLCPRHASAAAHRPPRQAVEEAHVWGFPSSDEDMTDSDDPETRSLLFTDGGGALRARRFRVRVVGGPDVGRAIEAAEGTLIVGSHRNADLALTDRNVSRFHVELQPSGAGLRITDLESTNGSFLADVRLGSVVVSGDVELRLGATTVLSIEAFDAAVPVERFEGDHFGSVLGASAAMRQLFALLERVAPTEATVLLEGETGTGKELVAEAIHARSQRAQVRSSSSTAARCRTTLIERRAVRPRARRLHRRARRRATALVRARRRRHAVPRRDRRAAARPAAAAAARAREARGSRRSARSAA